MLGLFVSYNVPISKYFVTLCWVQYLYHSYVGKITWCRIFWWFYQSPSLLLDHSSCFFKHAWPLFYGSDYCPHILGVLGIDCSCICHLFPVGWLPYSFRCNSTCWDQHFRVPDGIWRCLSHATPGCPFSCPTFWELSGLVLPWIVGFFGESLTQAKVYFPSSRRSFGYCASTFLFMCESRGKHLVINSFYYSSI